MPGSEFSTGCRGSNINFNLVENLLPGMLKIRLQRFGKKNQPSYRVVLVEHTAPPKGKFLEILGSYNPRKKEKNFKKERIEHWLSKGVQLSPTIHNLLVDAGILKKEKIRAWKPKQREEKEKPSEVKPAETKVAAPEGGEPSPRSPRFGEAGGEAGRPETSGREEPKAIDNPLQ